MASGDADRTLTLPGNPTLADWFDQSVKAAASPAFADNYLTAPSKAVGFAGATLINGTLAPSVGSNNLTVAIKTKAGGDPSATDAVHVTAATGDYTVVTLTAVTSIRAASGATLGTANNVPFRLWVVGFNDGGTFRLGLVNCVVAGASPTQVCPLEEYNIRSSTQISSGATSAAVFYTRCRGHYEGLPHPGVHGLVERAGHGRCMLRADA